MVTIQALAGSSVSLFNGKNTVIAFPKKPMPDAINMLSAPEEDPKGTAISWPGEYDIAGIAIKGIGHLEGQQVSYIVQMDDVRIAFPSTPVGTWSQADIEHLGDVHVLILPAENPKQAQALIDEVDPRVLILVAGSDGSLNPDVLKAAGAMGKETVAEYKVKGSLPTEGRDVVVLAA